jgi:hypothetical protein
MAARDARVISWTVAVESFSIRPRLSSDSAPRSSKARLLQVLEGGEDSFALRGQCRESRKPLLVDRRKDRLALALKRIEFKLLSTPSTLARGFAMYLRWDSMSRISLCHRAICGSCSA